MRVEAFYKKYDHLLEANPQEDPNTRGDEFFVVNGDSYGLDVLLRQFERGGKYDDPSLGVDFKGGTLVYVKFDGPPNVDRIRSAIDRAGNTATVTRTYTVTN